MRHAEPATPARVRGKKLDGGAFFVWCGLSRQDKLASPSTLLPRMPMKRHLASLLLATFLCTLAAAGQTAGLAASPTADISSVAPPVHPATEAQIREYFALNHAVELARQAMKDSIHASRVTSAPYFTPGFWDDMEKAVLDVDLVQYFVPAYQRYLSEEDMAAAVAF